MKLLRYFVIAAATGLALGAGAGIAGAFEKPCIGCGGGFGGKHGGGKPPITPGTLFDGGLFHKQKLPAFQAAPWYLYWPYDAHFLTPAPVNGPFYGPPLPGNFPVNPYFPGPAGFAGYGHGIPGGPPPGLGSMVPPVRP